MSYDLATADTRHAVERALLAYIATASVGGKTVAALGATYPGEADADPVHPLQLCAICGKIGTDGAIPEEWSKVLMPALIIAAPDSEPHIIGYDIVDCTVQCVSSASEDDGPRKMAERAAWLDCLFDQDRLDDIPAALNAGPVPVTVIGIERDRPVHIDDGQRFYRGIKLRVHAYAQAATT